MHREELRKKANYHCLKIGTDLLHEADINYVYILQNDRVLVGTAVGLFEVSGDQLKRASFSGNNLEQLQSTNIRCIHESKDGIWFGTDAGLFWYNQRSGRLNSYTTEPNNLNSLAHATVMSIAEDSDGTILVGTLGGLNFLDPATSQISRIKGRLDERQTLNNEFVNSLYTDRDGNVWIGTEKGGVNKYSMYQKPFYSFRNHPLIRTA